MKLSIAIESSTYAVTHRFELERALDYAVRAAELLAQPFEIIVTIPEVPPGTFDPRIRFIGGVRGYYRQKNSGCAAARGEYVTFWDSDCRPDPLDYLARAVAYLDTHPDVSAICGASRYDGTSWLTRVNTAMNFGYTHDPQTEPSSARPVLSHNLTIRRAAFPPHPFGRFPARFGGDRYFTDEALAAGLRIAHDRTLQIAHEDLSYSPIAWGERQLRNIFYLAEPVRTRPALVLARAWYAIARLPARYMREVWRWGGRCGLGVFSRVAAMPLIAAYAVIDALAVGVLTVCPPLLRRWLDYYFGE